MEDFESDVIGRLARIEVHLENFTENRKDHEERLRNIETKVRYMNGATGVLAAVLAFLGYHITLH